MARKSVLKQVFGWMHKVQLWKGWNRGPEIIRNKKWGSKIQGFAITPQFVQKKNWRISVTEILLGKPVCLSLGKPYMYDDYLFLLFPSETKKTDQTICGPSERWGPNRTVTTSLRRWGHTQVTVASSSYMGLMNYGCPIRIGNPNIFWLVVFRHPSEKIWVRQLGWWHSQYMESHNPAMFQSPPTRFLWCFCDNPNEHSLITIPEGLGFFHPTTVGPLKTNGINGSNFSHRSCQTQSVTWLCETFVEGKSSTNSVFTSHVW